MLTGEDGQGLSNLWQEWWAFFSLINEPLVVYYAAVRFIMNSLRTEGRSGSGVVINEPGRACFQASRLPLKDLHRPQGSNPLKVINDCQSLIKRSAKKFLSPGVTLSFIS
jgi:hypothetical protein